MHHVCTGWLDLFCWKAQTEQGWWACWLSRDRTACNALRPPVSFPACSVFCSLSFSGSHQSSQSQFPPFSFFHYVSSYFFLLWVSYCTIIFSLIFTAFSFCISHVIFIFFLLPHLKIGSHFPFFQATDFPLLSSSICILSKFFHLFSYNIFSKKNCSRSLLFMHNFHSIFPVSSLISNILILDPRCSSIHTISHFATNHSDSQLTKQHHQHTETYNMCVLINTTLKGSEETVR